MAAKVYFRSMYGLHWDPYFVKFFHSFFILCIIPYLPSCDGCSSPFCVSHYVLLEMIGDLIIKLCISSNAWNLVDNPCDSHFHL